MGCKRISQKESICVLPDGTGRFTAVMRRKVGKGYNILEKKLKLTKKQASKYASKWEKERKSAMKHVRKRRTPYP